MDLTKLTDAELVDVILQCQAGENVLHRERLRAEAEYDRREAWMQDGATSMGAWVTGVLGAGRDTALEEVRVAQAFDGLPVIAAQFEDGSLSWDQARAVTVFATPETDAYLASEARKFSAQQLRRMARRFRPKPLEEANEEHAAREMRISWDLRNNVLRFSGRLAGDQGAVLEKALDRFMSKKNLDPKLPNYNHFAYRADALAAVCSAALASDGDADRATIGVHVDARVLAGEKGMAELDATTAICMETAQRLACDSRWYIVVDGPDGLPIGIGRVSRSVPPWLAREIHHRDAGCRFPGCGRKLWTNIHHKIPWAEGGGTDLDNSITLCWSHHRLLHEGKWKLEGNPNQEVTFVTPDGRRFSEGPAPLRPDLKERVDTIVLGEHETVPCGETRVVSETGASSRAGPAP